MRLVLILVNDSLDIMALSHVQVLRSLYYCWPRKLQHVPTQHMKLVFLLVDSTLSEWTGSINQRKIFIE